MPKPKHLSTILTLLTLTNPISTASTCYKLNGDAAYKDFIPCNQFSGATSYCCGANRQNTNATYTNDICLTNGLCIGVGVAIGVFALLGIAFWFLRRRRAAHSAPHENTNLMPVNSPSPNYGNNTKEIYTRPQELDSRVVGHELDPAARLGEVEGDTAFKGT
ncbi:MAG: Uncharacterized protein AUREO_016610 [Aureobasidium pullulans]|nr:MAG: Uncharacterized protein AUREO_016610 [Aureobasidium pullulans]